jgi:6-phosphofructokinase
VESGVWRLRTSKEARCVVLGHLQRGGSPNAFDRMLAANFGSAAVRALMRGKRDAMVALQAANIRTVPLAEAIAILKTVPPESQRVRTARRGRLVRRARRGQLSLRGGLRRVMRLRRVTRMRRLWL